MWFGIMNFNPLGFYGYCSKMQKRQRKEYALGGDPFMNPRAKRTGPSLFKRQMAEAFKQLENPAPLPRSVFDDDPIECTPPAHPPVLDAAYAPLPDMKHSIPKEPSIFPSMALIGSKAEVKEEEEADLRVLDVMMWEPSPSMLPSEASSKLLKWANEWDTVVQKSSDPRLVLSFVCDRRCSLVVDNLMILNKIHAVMRDDVFRVVTCPSVTPERDRVHFPERFWALVTGFEFQIRECLLSMPKRFGSSTGKHSGSVKELPPGEDDLRWTYGHRQEDSMVGHPMALGRHVFAHGLMISPAELEAVLVEARQRCILENAALYAMADPDSANPSKLAVKRFVVGPLLYHAMNTPAFAGSELQASEALQIPKAAADQLISELDLKAWPLGGNLVERQGVNLEKVSVWGPALTMGDSQPKTREWFWRLLLAHQFCPPARAF